MSEPMTPQQAQQEAERILRAAFEVPTSYRDTAPAAPTGAEPVPQPETRIVPTWAVGTAVASIGLGAGSVGIGCAVWLASQGLASITVFGVAAALAPFVGVALVVLAAGAVLNRATPLSTTTTNVYNGQVVKNTQVDSHTRGMFSRSRTEVQA